MAVRQHRAGHLAQAERLYRGVLAGSPRHLGALGELPRCSGCRPIGRWWRSRPTAAALALDDRKPDWHCKLASAQRPLGRLDEAIRHCRRAVELDPDHVEAHFSLAGMFAQRGQSDDAAASYRRVLALKPDVVEAHHNLPPKRSMAQGQFDGALVHFRQALALDPKLAEGYLNIGNLFLAQGRLAEAAEQYQHGLAINADFPKSQHSLGLALAMQGKLAEAVPRFDRHRAQGGFQRATTILRGRCAISSAEEALRALAQAIARNGTAETKGLFVQFLRDHCGIPQVDDLPGLLVRALSEPWAGPGKVGLVVAPLVKNDATLRRYIAHAANAWPQRLAGPDLWEEPGLAAISDTVCSPPAEIRTGLRCRAGAFSYQRPFRPARNRNGRIPGRGRRQGYRFLLCAGAAVLPQRVRLCLHR